MSIELSPEIREALAARPGDPLWLVDPGSSTDYVLVRREEYDRLRSALDESTDAAVLQARLDEATRIRREWVRENPY